MSREPNSETQMSLSRRDFIRSAAAAGLIGTTMFPSAAMALARLPRAGVFGHLDATAEGGIDIHIDRTPMSIGGRRGNAITMNGSLPAPMIHMREGKEALIRVHNHLRESSSIHWHGLILPFTMDGTPGISFPGIAAGETFTYRFPVRQNGTFWYHSHSGLQQQLGHYGMLLMEPAERDPVEYDVEFPVILSDWTFENPHRVLRKLKTMEGYYNFQRPTLANIDDQMEAMDMSLGEVIGNRLKWDGMRMDPTDIADVTGATYTFLINGKTHWENPTFVAESGKRVRLRFVNASSTTMYDIRIPGLPMTVVQADGHNIQPVETDEFRIAVAETYDVIVTLPDDRAYTLFAETTDRSGFARGTLAPMEGLFAEIPPQRMRPMLTMADMGMVHEGMEEMHGKEAQDGQMAKDGHSRDPQDEMKHEDHAQHDRPAASGTELPTSNLPDQMMHGSEKHGPGSVTMLHTAYRRVDDPGLGLGKDGWRVLTYKQMRTLRTPEDRRPPTRQIDLHLTGNMHEFIWGFDGKKWSESEMLRFQYGERLRINMINDTMMSHPIHLHGMFFDLYTGEDYAEVPRKHTVNVQPAELLTVDITVDAPGQWAFHCHLLYHMESGMFRTVAVVRSLEEGPIHAHS